MEEAGPSSEETSQANIVVGQDGGPHDDPRYALVQRILASDLFVRAPTLSRFLLYVSGQVFNGCADQINEHVIGIEVFGRKPGYDSNDDNIVRASASRLRVRLETYFATEGSAEAWHVSIPKGSYVPRFTPRISKSNGTANPIAFDSLPVSEARSVPQNGHSPLVQSAPISTSQVDEPRPESLPAPAGTQRRGRLLFAAVFFAAAFFGLGLWWLGSRGLAVRDRTHEQVAPAAHYVPDPEARRLYLEGRFYWAKHKPDPIHQSIVCYEKAIRLDPNYALPYSGLADAYAITASGLPPAERLAPAKTYAEKALSLDEFSAEAHTSLAFILYKYEWNWPQAELHFGRALQLDPSYALAHHWFGEFLVLRGRPEEGLTQLRQALAIEPLSLPIRNDVARALYRTRHYDEAIAEARRVLDMDPTYNAYPILTYSYEQKHEYAKAVDADLESAQVSRLPDAQLAALRKTFDTAGWQAYWKARIALLKKEPPGSVPAYVLAEDNLRAGNKELALHLLEQSFSDRGDAPLLIGAEPLWDPLRTDQRFAYLLRRAGFE